MSLLGELIKTVIEAVEESQGSGRAPSAPRPVAYPQRGADVDEILATQKRILAKAAEAQAAATAAAHQAQAQAKIKANDARQAAQRREAPPSANKAVYPTADRLRRLLHNPRTMRELMLLREIIDPPLALRRRR